MENTLVSGHSPAGKMTKRASIVLFIVSMLTYLISVPLLFPFLGGAVVGFLVIPLMIAGWFAGMKKGFVCGLLGTLIVNSFMLAFLYNEWAIDVMVHHQGIPGLIVLTFLGGGAGYFRELRDRYVREINGKNEAQRALEFSRKRIERILQTVPSAVFSVDPQQRITSWNRAAEQVTGLGAEEVLGKKCVDIWYCNACRNRCGLLDDAIPKPITGREVEIELPGGRVITIVKNVDTLYEDGLFAGGVESFIDVTRRKQMEREIEETARGFKMLFNHSNEGLFLIDTKNGCCIEVNPALSTITGYERDELLAMHHARLSPSGDHEMMKRKMVVLAKNGAIDDFETQVLRKDGSLRHVIFGATTIVWQGRAVQYGFIRDITSIKQMQLELERKNREIVALTNTITHDLRNPLTGIRGILELHCIDAAAQQVDEDNLALHRLALKEVDYMQGLLEDLLDAARLDSGTAQIEWKPVDLAGIVRKVIELYKPQILQRSIAVAIDADSISLCADGRALEKVFMNLVGNAITYMGAQSNPSISITASDDGIRVTISVSDNGMGIPNAILPLVFDKFRRGTNVGAIKGTGLGLAIVKGIVEAHGGAVRAESVEGAGSTFIVTIPHLDERCVE